jgi:mycofactocin system glycosyltransferase
VVRLSATGIRALAELRDGPVASAAGAALARRLTDAGLAHPRPEGGALDVTVVIPVRDRASELDRCLAAAGTEQPVLVVDDGSTDPSAVAAVSAKHSARLVRRTVNGGPGPARNTALRLVHTEFVAFLDSDCIPPPGWIAALAGHFTDPLVAAVAPRILETTPGPSPLDLGNRAARIAPLTRVSYVPTAALLARRAVLGDGFDESLRYGEDVDLVWRLIEAGWRLRYEPSVQIAHTAPDSLPARLRRRFHYGTTAAPLTRRHPGAVAPLVLQPGPAITVAALLALRPLAAGAAFTTATSLLTRRLHANGLPAHGIIRAMAAGVWQTWLGIGRWCGQFTAPALIVLAAHPGGRTQRTRWGRRLGSAALLASPPLAHWARHKPRTDPARHTVTVLADEVTYGAGVWVGCLRERRFGALLPSLTTRPFEGLTRPTASAGEERSSERGRS